MQVFKSEKLKQLTDKLDLLPKLKTADYSANFLNGKKKKALQIYGLSKTGKTTILLHAISGCDALYIKPEYDESETAADYAGIILNAEQQFIAIDDFDKINGRETLFDLLYDEVCAGKRIAFATGLQPLFLSEKTEMLCSNALTWNEWEMVGGASAEEYISQLSEAFPDAEAVLLGGGSDETAAALAKMFILAPAQKWNGSCGKKYICIPALARRFSENSDDLLRTRLASVLWWSRYSEDNLYYFTSEEDELFAMTQKNGRFVYLFGVGEKSVKALSLEAIDEEFPDGEILGRIAVINGGEFYSFSNDTGTVKFIPVQMEEKIINYGML